MDVQKKPLKIYIQDIFRAKNTIENKYIYQLFGMKFKNVMIQGVVTDAYNKTSKSINLEISDATGSVKVYYDSTKNNNNLNNDIMKELSRDLSKLYAFNNNNSTVMSSMFNLMSEKKENMLNFVGGHYVCIVGDIFVEDVSNNRMVSAFHCKHTSIERDLVWMEELRYIYEKFYLWNKVPEESKTLEKT
ncbi:PREDICTED: uncharacterized protein LOC106113524 [Papilio xuthus]|uniref:Uncharacterized protein LOC106113524 n=1 Tax=Papilio xuthus TaxID=66420 RepID=A0AAJ6YYY0_PAPXU|nr:PREDICTED: uncharacterized protein LOC106113524 [Papilio xuthus]